MYVKKNKLIGEQLNPFTNLYDKVYDYENSENVWVEPKGFDKEHIVTNWKAICSGSVIEIWNYQEPLFYGFDTKSDVRKGKQKVDTDFIKRRDNFIRSQFKLRRLINANVNFNSKFITLTFKENLSDISVAKYKFKKFIERMNRRRLKKKLDKLKYVYVIEFQKRGSIHFHCIFFNLGFFRNDELFKIWKYGFTKINKIDDVDNVGSYVVKYMEKSLSDSRMNGVDLYGRSKGNLEEPLVIKRPLEVKQILKAYKNKVVFKKIYKSDYNGKIEYMQINLKR